MTQSDVAKPCGVTYVAVGLWERGETMPSLRNLSIISDLLAQDFLQIAATEEVPAEPTEAIRYERPLRSATPNARRDTLAPNVRKATQGGGNAKIEVRGQAVCGPGSKADFRLNGQTIGKVQRPRAISGLEDVFAVYVVNDSLWPRYDPGDTVYVDPHKPAAIGEYVLIELHGEDDEPGDGFIKKLVRRTPTKLVVLQHNPEAELSFDLKEVKSVARIIPWNELIGR